MGNNEKNQPEEAQNSKNFYAEKIGDLFDKISDQSEKEVAQAEFDTLKNNLSALKVWCSMNQKKTFWDFFEEQMYSAHYRFLKAKQKAWSKKREWAKHLCSGVLCGAAALGAQAVPNFVKSWFAGTSKVVDVFFQNSNWPLWIVIALGCVLAMYIYKENDKKRNYHETWTRHTLCDSRLQLVMSEFLMSAMDDDAYQKLVDNTFAVLHQNLDQFAVNMCPNGMAPREQSGSKEKEKKEGK